MMNKTSNVRQFERPFGEKKQLVERQDFIHIVTLAAIILVIGSYLINTTVLIAKDGTFYIEYAKQITDNSIEAMRNMPPCPGKKFPESLQFKLLLSIDSARSPNVPVITIIAVKTNH